MHVLVFEFPEFCRFQALGYNWPCSILVCPRLVGTEDLAPLSKEVYETDRETTDRHPRISSPYLIEGILNTQTFAESNGGRHRI